MNNKIIGTVLIVAGVALTIWGYNIYDAVLIGITKVR
jgi:hypothetical protein